MHRSAAGTIALLIAIVVANGCAGAGATTTPIATPTASIPAQPTTTPSSASPSAVPSRPPIPAGMPVMPGAEPADPATIEPRVIAQWTVDAIGPRVYQYYLDALPAAGFAVRGRFPGGNAAIIRFETPEGMTLDLALVGEGEHGRRTRIELVLPEGP